MALLMLGLFGAALLYGDGMITPAISVLSRGRRPRGRDARVLDRFVVPITVAILIGLFLVQKRGTARHRHGLRPGDAASGSSPSPPLGMPCDRQPPRRARGRQPAATRSRFLRRTRLASASSSSARSCSCITGGEALYADMGHFGTKPIRARLVRRRLPGALAATTSARARCSSSAAPPSRRTRSTRWPHGWLALPDGRHRDGRDGRRVAGAHLGRVLAHAAGGAARLLAARHDRPHVGPRRRADLRSRDQLRRSWSRASRSCSASASRTNLAAAYGIAVTGTMSITTLLYLRRRAPTLGLVASATRRWSPRSSSSSTSRSSSPTSPRSSRGGWFPLAVAVVVFTVMTTWKRGRAELGAQHAPRRCCRSTLFLRRSGADQAAPRAGHRGLHDVDDGRHAAGAAAPLQAQQGAARAGRAALGRDARTCPSSRPRARRGRGARATASSRSRAHYGFMQTPNVLEDARSAPQRRASSRDPRHELLPRPRDAPGHRQAAMARWRKVALRVHVAQRAPGDGVLRHPAEPRRRARHADRAVGGDAAPEAEADSLARPRKSLRR